MVTTPQQYQAGMEERICAGCPAAFTAYHYNPTRHCSLSCAQTARRKAERDAAPPTPERVPHDPRGPLTRAVEARDTSALLAYLVGRSVTAGECLIWQGRSKASKKGGGRYPIASVSGKKTSLHRVVAEVVHGPLGTQPVHHRCSETLCVNPDHLEPVTHRDNAAEMLERNYYLARIAELERALAAVAPRHRALNVLPLAV